MNDRCCAVVGPPAPRLPMPTSASAITEMRAEAPTKPPTEPETLPPKGAASTSAPPTKAAVRMVAYSMSSPACHRNRFCPFSTPMKGV